MNTDYTAYSNDDVVAFGQMSILDDSVDSSAEDLNENVEVAKTEDIMLKVANCDKCYIREKADKNSPHIAVVSNNDDLLVIGSSEINDDNLWHNVCTESGAEGYIMSDFTEEIVD